MTTATDPTTTAADLMTGGELVDLLGCTKKTLAILSRHGLEPAVGDRKLYRRSEVLRALAAEAVRPEPEPEELTLWLVRGRSAGGQVLETHLERPDAAAIRRGYARSCWIDEDGRRVRTRAYVQKIRVELPPEDETP